MKFRELFDRYMTDPDSAYHGLRFCTREGYRRNIDRINLTMGDVDVDAVNARAVLRIHAAWVEGTKIALGHQLVTMLRIGVSFGASILEDPACRKLFDILGSLRFKNSKAREDWMTAEQAQAVRDEAIGQNWLAIALAQAIQFDCALRQKDVIGEWVPVEDPEPSTILSPDRQMKWVRGITREEVDADLVLTHKTSKRGKVLTFPLASCPSVTQEWFAAPPSGPIIIDPQTDLPFEAWKYRRIWRELATKAGVPAKVWNMDSRAGRITERLAAGVSLDDARKLAGHNQVATTVRYSRNTPEAIERALGPKWPDDTPPPNDGSKPWDQD